MMRNLRKLLSTSSKIRRNRQRLLNLQIQIFVWLIEFFSGLIFCIWLLVPRHKDILDNVVHLFSTTIYYVIIPSIYTINNDDFKSSILENNLYITFTNKYFAGTVNKIFNANDDEDNSPKTENDNNKNPKVNNWVKNDERNSN